MTSPSKAIIIADLTRMIAGAAQAVMVPASARDLRLLDDWRRLEDTQPPLTVRGMSLHSQFPFEVGDLVEVSDLMDRRMRVRFTGISLMTIAALTDAHIQAMGYLRRDQVPDFAGRRVWYVTLADLERLPDEPKPDAASVEVRHGDTGQTDRRLIDLRDGDA